MNKISQIKIHLFYFDKFTVKHSQILLHVGSIVRSRHNLENEKKYPPQTFHLNAIMLGVLNFK